MALSSYSEAQACANTNTGQHKIVFRSVEDCTQNQFLSVAKYLHIKFLGMALKFIFSKLRHVLTHTGQHNFVLRNTFHQCAYI